MRFAPSLLSQARHLVRHEARRPKQTTLRRAISTVYYALFHLLTAESARALISGDSAGELRELVQRAFDHAVMKQVSRAFGTNRLPDAVAPLLTNPLPADFRFVADTFVQL